MGNLSLGSTVTTAERGREFWRGVLLARGFTALPQWTLDPVAGVGEHEARIPDELVAALRRVANELAVPLSSMLLTAHAKVLGALSGEIEVCTGYALELESPLPLRMTLGPRSWREVLLDAARAEAELLAHRGFPVDDLRRELGLSELPFETVFEFGADGGGKFPEHTVLRVAFVEREGLVLRLRYKTDVLDAECAARIAGYHRTALALIAADPVAEHARQTLLSAEELRFQLHGLAGRRVLTHRAAFPGRPHREDAFPGRLPARAHRAGQHRHARSGARVVVRSRDALHRRGIRGGPSRGRSRN